MGWIPLVVALAAKAGQSYFGNKAKKKQAESNRNANIAQLTIGQKQREDSRRAHLALADSMLNRIPKTTAGGGVNTNVGLDPELVKQLGVERTYDFASAVPDGAAGSGSAFLSGLFGGVADTVPYGVGGGSSGGGGGGETAPWVDVSSGAGQTGVQLPGGRLQVAQLHPVGD